MKKITSVLLLLALLALALPVGVAATNPVTPEGLYYEVVDDQVIITDCVESVTGELTIPSEIDGKPVTAIKNTAFFGCHSLAAVVIPEGVIAIGDQAFHSCTNLSKVTIPASVTSIGFDAFHNTAYFNNVKNWDNHLLYIGDCLVAGNKDNLAGSVVINEGTRLIADYTFFQNQFTAVSIPASVKVVGKNAFAECAKLADVYYGGKQADWEALTKGEGNDLLGKAKKHYEEVLEKPDPQASSNNTNTPPSDNKKPDLWLWVSIVSGVVAVVTGVMMFLPKKKEQEPAADEETSDEQTDAAKPDKKKKK